MAKVLITGNKGFFGSRFERYYRSKHEVFGIDRDDVDIVDRNAVMNTVRSFNPDIVIHAAGITVTSFSDKYPDLTKQINVDGAVNVADAAQEVGARLLFFSTEQVFNGNDEPGPYSETDRPVPDTMYGRTKLEAEDLLRKRIDNLWILRFTWMFGLPEFGQMVNPNVVWDALRIALSGRPARIPVNEYRGMTWVYHMLRNILSVLDLTPGTYHIGSQNDMGRYDVFRHIFGELGIDYRADELLLPDYDKYPDGPRDIRLNTDKLSVSGIRFPTTAEAITDCLSAFMLKGMASS